MVIKTKVDYTEQFGILSFFVYESIQFTLNGSLSELPDHIRITFEDILQCYK